MADEANAPALTISVSFLYQLIGAKEVELAALRERLAAQGAGIRALQAEVAEIRASMTTNDAAPEGRGDQLA